MLMLIKNFTILRHCGLKGGIINASEKSSCQKGGR